MDQDEKHPILSGLVALVAVAAAVGLVLGVVVLAATHVLGLGGDASAKSSAGASLYLPTPSATDEPSGPMVTLSGEPSETAGSDHTPTAPPSTSKAPQKKITLQASTVSAASMQLFDLSGVYPGGEGAVLRLQRQAPGSGWEDFGIQDVAVSGGQFSTQVQTGRTGPQKFRMKDIDSGKLSNVVTVTIG